MECLSRAFISSMHNLLGSDKLVVATVAVKGRGFVEQIKQRDDIEMWEVTTLNRDQMPAVLLNWLKKSKKF